MKRILILINSAGGLYDFRNQLLKRLLLRYQVFVSVPDYIKVDQLAEEGCQVIHTPINRHGVNPIEDYKLYRAYKNLIKYVNPDLVLTYTIKPNIYGGFACRMRRVPYISTITGLGTTFQRKGLFKNFIVFLYRMGLRGAECVFFQNEQNRDIFTQNKINGKSTCLVKGSGVDLEIHRYEEYSPDNKVSFLFIGRIMKDKGINEFLQAAQVLHSESIRFEILGACDEDYQDKLDEYTSNGVITYKGFHPNVHDHIKDSSAIVLPTYHEGMSNVLMEASATGRPVIATQISGCKEIFDEGITGYSCVPGSSESLIAALQKFISLSVEERARMGRRAREKMEREFDRTLVTDVYINVVNNVLEIKKND